MAFSNSQLAQKLSNLIDYWSDFAEEYANWLGGTINGGPNSDGRYELTDYTGNTRLVKAPARLEEDVSGQVDSAEAHKDAAAASETAAAGSASTATTQAGLADTARIASEDAQSDAEVARDGAQNAATNAIAARSAAQAARDKSQLWAEEDFEVEVETDAYSAKHWATVAQGFAGDVDSGLYYQATEVDSLLDGKSDTTHKHDADYAALSHTHDGRYYTESEVDSLLSGKSNTGHTHDHGSLTGLSDNDHPQYARKASNETISGRYTFTHGAGVNLEAAAPEIRISATGAAVDNKNWLQHLTAAGDLRYAIYPDGFGGGSASWMQVFRTGTTVDEIQLDATTLDFNGAADFSSTINVGGALTATDASYAIRIEAANPKLFFEATNGSTDSQKWDIVGVSLTDDLRFRALNDAESSSTIWMNVFRAGTTIDEIELNATLLDFNGDVDISGDVTIGGGATVNSANDGDTLLTLNTDRPWEFQQVGDDAATQLALVNMSGGKVFTIGEDSNKDLFMFRAVPGASFVRFDGPINSSMPALTIRNNHTGSSAAGSGGLETSGAKIQTIAFEVPSDGANYAAQIHCINYNNSGTGWFNTSSRYDAGLRFETLWNNSVVNALDIKHTGLVTAHEGLALPGSYGPTAPSSPAVGQVWFDTS